MAFFRAANPIWTIFDVDGKLAAGGRIDTYRSADKEERKATYLDPAGTVEAPNPLRLDGIGQLATEIYWNDDEKYYLELYDFQGRLIRTIDNFPDASSGGGTSVVGLDFENHLLNGQFRFHNKEEYNPLTADEITIAPYWLFRKSNASATDKILITRINLGDDTEASPIYEVNYICTGQGTGETYKDFLQKMADVRTFEQSKLTFSMQVYSDVPRTIEVFFVQNFGTGGSPSAPVLTSIGSFNLTGGIEEKIHNTITAPSLSGKTRGTNGNDYVALVIRMPLDTIANIKFTNVYLMSGDKVLPYPRLTKEKEDSELLGAMIPEISDNDHGKVITANRNHMYSLAFPVPIGGLLQYAAPTYTDDDDWAICHGQTVSINQNNGRYKRLYNAIGHQWGRGVDAWVCGASGNTVTIGATTTLSVTSPGNGALSPGFTFTQYIASSGSRFLFNSYIHPTGFDIVIKTGGPGLTGYINNTGGGAAGVGTYQSGNAFKRQVSNATIKAGGAITAGQYFTVYNTSNTGYTFWYAVDGAGVSPSVPNTTSIRIDVFSSDTASQVAIKTLGLMAGIQVDVIITAAASSIPPGSYININTHALQYYAWFKIGGAGSDPKISGKIGLLIELASSDTAGQVATKLAERLNSEFFQIPDMRGYFARGFDPTAITDFDLRLGYGIGMIQYDNVIEHTHPYSYSQAGDPTTEGGGTGTNPKLMHVSAVNSITGLNLDYNHFGGNNPVGAGSYETRPINVAVNYLIKL